MASPPLKKRSNSSHRKILRSPFQDFENLNSNSTPARRRRYATFINPTTPLSLPRPQNILFQEHKVTREERWKALGNQGTSEGCTVWFTGLSGAGKTTIAFALEKILIQLGIAAYGLDGDNIRHGLCKDLSFEKQDRTENIRRVAEVAKLFADMGAIAIASFISPSVRDRKEAKRIHQEAGLKFFEIYVNTPIEVCEARDPKRLYEKARSGKISGFTGIDSTYEVPENPDLIINTATHNEQQCLYIVICFLTEKGILPDKTKIQAIHTICDSLPFYELFVTDEGIRNELSAESHFYPTVELTLVDLQWLQVLAEGWAYPLQGFMRERQYLQSLHHGQLLDLKRSFEFQTSTCDNNQSSANETISSITSTLSEVDSYFPFSPINQSIPIVLSIHHEQKDQLYANGVLTNRVNLTYQNKLIAILFEPEIFLHQKEERICRQFGHADSSHPTIAEIRRSGDYLLGGELKVLERIRYNDGLDEFRKTPLELRKLFEQARCDAVFAFQLRNPIHNGHALLMQFAREHLLSKGYRNPMLLLHPLGGWTKEDDVPLRVRMAQHQAIIDDGILDTTQTVLAIFPSPMLYAGPTEVQWHARARLACGIKAYIVGRDPAGIQNSKTGNYLYEPSHGAKVLSMAPGLQGLEIIPFRVAAYNKRTKAMEFYDDSHKDDYEFISGTKMRTLARDGGTPPDGFMAPKAWQVLSSYYRQT